MPEGCDVRTTGDTLVIFIKKKRKKKLVHGRRRRYPTMDSPCR